MSLRKVVAINAGRKTFNTAKVLKAALEGAKANGAQTELIHLQDYVYTGCKGCMACKMKKNTPPKMCLQKDQLNPIIEKALEADGLIVASPIYMMQPNGFFRCFSERFCYPFSRYGTKETYYPNKKQKAALIFTMGLKKEEHHIVEPGIEVWKHSYQALIPNTKCFEVMRTFHVKNYSKYELDCMNEPGRKQYNDQTWQASLDQAYKIGQELALAE